MRYEKRWWYLLSTIILVFIASYLLDFKSLIQQINQYKTVHTNQLTELTQLKAQKNNHPKIIINNNDKLHPFLLETLMPLLQINHLSLRALHDQGMQTNNGVEMSAVRLTISGRFVDMQRLLITMTQLKASVLMNFSFKATSSNQALFTLDLLLWQGINLPFAGHENAFRISNQNPLCFSKDELIAESTPILLQRSSLSVMKMIGYISAEKGAKALVLLPGGGIAEVVVGMMIGAEHANVVSINEDAITLDCKGKPILLTQAESYMHEEEVE